MVRFKNDNELEEIYRNLKEGEIKSLQFGLRPDGLEDLSSDDIAVLMKMVHRRV